MCSGRCLPRRCRRSRGTSLPRASLHNFALAGGVCPDQLRRARATRVSSSACAWRSDSSAIRRCPTSCSRASLTRANDAVRPHTPLQLLRDRALPGDDQPHRSTPRMPSPTVTDLARSSSTSHTCSSTRMAAMHSRMERTSIGWCENSRVGADRRGGLWAGGARRRVRAWVGTCDRNAPQQLNYRAAEFQRQRGLAGVWADRSVPGKRLCPILHHSWCK